MNSLDYKITKTGICEISFQNKNKNSFSPKAASELDSILDELIKNKEAKALLFLSNNKNFFCVGGDLKYYSSLPDKKPGIDANLEISRVLTKLSTLHIPSAVCVEGLCIGGGVELISCFDFVVATNSSLFSLWQRKIGLGFGWAGGKRLLGRMSNKNITRKFLDTTSITSYEALDINLIDKVVPDFKLKQSALNWLERSLNLPAEPVLWAKKVDYLNSEQSAFESLWLQEDHINALAKFNKK